MSSETQKFARQMAALELATIQPPKEFTLPMPGEVITIDKTNYYIGQFIGRGAFGEVYECSDDWRNNLVAKIISPRSGQSYEAVRDAWNRELKNLFQVRHPNVTFIHNAFEYKHTFYLIIERCSMTLEHLVGHPKSDGRIWFLPIARDILYGLHYLHILRYVHKDLHPGNIFVSQQREFMIPAKDPVWSFKIGDMGISNLESAIDVFNTTLAKWMLPPEFLNPSEFGAIGKQVDIYHLGLILLSILSNQWLDFSTTDILAGKPRQLAENLKSPYTSALSHALRRHVNQRTQTAIEMWQEIVSAIPKSATLEK